MIDTDTQAPAVLTQEDGERRRPGRIENPPAALIPLLRQLSDVKESSLPLDDDNLRPAKGIAVAVLLASLFWVPLFLILR